MEEDYIYTVCPQMKMKRGTCFKMRHRLNLTFNNYNKIGFKPFPVTLKSFLAQCSISGIGGLDAITR